MICGELPQTKSCRIVMTYGRKPHNSITNVHQQISTWWLDKILSTGPPEDGLKNGTETCRTKSLRVFNV